MKTGCVWQMGRDGMGCTWSVVGEMEEWCGEGWRSGVGRDGGVVWGGMEQWCGEGWRSGVGEVEEWCGKGWRSGVGRDGGVVWGGMEKWCGEGWTSGVGRDEGVVWIVCSVHLQCHGCYFSSPGL